MSRIYKNIIILCSIIICTLSMTSHAAPKSKLIEFWDDFESSSGLKVNHSPWQTILDRYLDTEHESGVNRFNYDQVSEADIQLLADYLVYLQSIDPRQLNRPRKKAFWLNLYNAAIVSMVLESKPSESIKSMGSIWRKKRLEVTMQKTSLDDIEHGILRPIYNDPRIHFGLTPATIGSGDLPGDAYTGDNVEELLERNTQRFFNTSNKGVYVDGNTLTLSSIFKWYKSDFGSSKANIKSFVKKYVSEDLQRQIDQTTRFSYQYNWSLNKP